MLRLCRAAQGTTGQNKYTRWSTAFVVLIIWALAIFSHGEQAALGQSRTPSSAPAGFVAQTGQANNPSLCVIDDSKHMLDIVDGQVVDLNNSYKSTKGQRKKGGKTPSKVDLLQILKKLEQDKKQQESNPKKQFVFEGFGNRGGKWLILSYFQRLLGYSQCCWWSAFGKADTACTSNQSSTARTASCNPNDPLIPKNPTDISPLVSTISNSRAVASSIDQNMFFVTNGLDWPTEGQRSQYKVEMNIGKTLCQWLKSDSKKDLILGIMQDNDTVLRRPNMVIGFVREFAVPSDDLSCELPITNLPPQYIISLSLHHNPHSIGNNDTLVIHPVGDVRLSVEGQRLSRPLTIADNGRVDIPDVFFKSPGGQELQAIFTFELPPSARKRFCWRVQARFDDADPVNTNCKLSDNGTSLQCEVPLSQLIKSDKQFWNVSFILTHHTSVWPGRLYEEHALVQTFKAFRDQCALQTQVQVRLPGARSINSLTLVRSK